MSPRGGSSKGLWVMSEESVVDKNLIGPAWISHSLINRAVAYLCTFVLTAVASFAMALSSYTEAFRATHIGAVLVVLVALHLVWRSSFVWCREFTFYACFVGYMSIALLWTRDLDLAMNTFLPAIDCLLVMVLFGSLIRYHKKSAVLAGALFGFSAGAAIYTLTQGFPFSIPDNFSYNAIAGMYLFGLFVTLMYACFRRSTAVLLAIAVVIMLHHRCNDVHQDQFGHRPWVCGRRNHVFPALRTIALAPKR